MPDARPWLFHFSLRAALWYRGSYICIRPRRHGLPGGGPVHPRAHGLWVPVSGPRMEEFVPSALWRPPIQHNYTQVLSGQRQQFLFGLPATALQRDIFTVRILIQGNKDKPLQLRLQLSTKVVPLGSDHVYVGRGQCDPQSGTWEGAMGRRASLPCDQDNTAMPSSLTFCGSKPGSTSSVALGGGCLCPKRSLLINHVSAPESPASTTRKREMMFALDAWKDTQRTQMTTLKTFVVTLNSKACISTVGSKKILLQFMTVSCLHFALRWWRVCLQCVRPEFNPWVRNIPWRGEWLPTPVLLPEKFRGWRSLVGYSPWGCKELDTIEQLMQDFYRIWPCI